MRLFGCLLTITNFWATFGILLCNSPQNSKLWRVIGGISFNESSLPWQAVFVSFDENGQGMLCGATVVEDRWLLTAAHCILEGYKKAFVMVGIDSLSSPKHTIRVDSVVIHPQYDAEEITNDIALIKTKSSVMKDGVQKVCLTSDDSQLTSGGQNVVASGFGLSLDVSDPILRFEVSDVVLSTIMPVIPQKKCRSEWQNLSFGGVTIRDSQLCAGSLMHGTSPGDSGGPLLARDNFGRVVQVGITSFGAAGLNGILDQDTYPGVYTRTSYYIDWIESVTSTSFFFTTFHALLILLIFQF